MSPRKRRPLELKGTDEQYFRTREIQGAPADAPVPVPETPKAPKPAPVKQSKAVKPKPAPQPEVEAEVVSRIVPLGKKLSRRVQELAEDVGVPVDDLLYAARKKAVTRVRGKLAAAKKPTLADVDKGGETIRIALKLSEVEMAKLVAWFDPLNLGIATKAIAPLLAEALRAEVKAICDSAAGSQS